MFAGSEGAGENYNMRTLQTEEGRGVDRRVVNVVDMERRYQV